MEFNGFPFATFGDLTRGFNAATTIDNDAANLCRNYSRGVKDYLQFRQHIDGPDHLHSLLEGCGRIYEQQSYIFLISESTRHNASVHAKRMTFTAH
jgi:hypothetical protein